MEVNVARWLPRSAANGPGERFVLWTQGCALACPGCWNPDTWSFAPRERMTMDAIDALVAETSGIEGVTFTGGEPFAQAAPLAELARRVRRRGLSVFVFTGHTLDEIRSPAGRALLAEVDVLVSGRFVQERRSVQLAWRGSHNQEVHFLTERYGLADMPSGEHVELHLWPDGRVVVTGFPEEPEALSSDSRA